MAKDATSTDGFTTAQICAICGKQKKCAISRDGKAALCWSVVSDRPTKIGSYFHWLNEAPPSLSQRKKRSRPSPPSNKYQPFKKLVTLSKESKVGLQRWAQKRSVTVESLVKLGALPSANSIKFPERLAELPFEVCGFNERYWTAIKNDDGTEQRFSFTGKRGFQFSECQSSKIPLLLIVEGFADVAAATDAGFLAIGRFTRAADLRPLKQKIQSLDASYRVIVLCENDSPKPGLPSPLEQVQERAAELQIEFGRNILVGSPPSQHKDLNDWWADLTDGMGHDLSEKTRHQHGKTIFHFLLKEVASQVIARNEEHAQEQIRQIDLQAELFRSERRRKKVDLDYEPSKNCAYRKVFKKELGDSDLAILGASLACDRWNCWSCRNRIIVPNWSIKIIEGFQKELGVFTRWLSDSEVKTMKRDMQKNLAVWALIRCNRTTEPDEVLPLERREWFCIASKPIRGQCEFLDFIGPFDGFSEFCGIVKVMVRSVDHAQKRPITTSRHIHATEEITADHWLEKIKKILTAGAVFAGMVSNQLAADVRSESYKSRNVIGRLPVEFLSIESNADCLLFCSETFPGDGISKQDAITMARAMLDSSFHAKASPRWYAKPTKGWERTEGNAGPSEVRAAAHKLKQPVRELDSGARSSMVDSCFVRIPSSIKEDFLREVHK